MPCSSLLSDGRCGLNALVGGCGWHHKAAITNVYTCVSHLKHNNVQRLSLAANVQLPSSATSLSAREAAIITRVMNPAPSTARQASFFAGSAEERLERPNRLANFHEHRERAQGASSGGNKDFVTREQEASSQSAAARTTHVAAGVRRGRGVWLHTTQATAQGLDHPGTRVLSPLFTAESFSAHVKPAGLALPICIHMASTWIPTKQRAPGMTV
jgi:hypothetical protein